MRTGRKQLTTNWLMTGGYDGVTMVLQASEVPSIDTNIIIMRV